MKTAPTSLSAATTTQKPPAAILPSTRDGDAGSAESFQKTDPDYWEQRLAHSTYGKHARPRKFSEFSAHIDHQGTGFFFPLESGAKEAAAARALEIYRTILTEGWPKALQRFSREFTLAIFWAENPMVFTYTTLYTVPAGTMAPRSKRPHAAKAGARYSVAIIEPDEGCRRALSEWLRSLVGYSCRGLFSNGGDALTALEAHSADLVLFNRQLPDLAAGEFAKSLQRAAPSIPSFGYRIYSCSDDLFVSQPGTSGGYYFRRRLPEQLLEPIRDSWRQSLRTPADWQACVFSYLSHLFRFPLAQEDARSPSTLTAREHDILSYLWQGSSDKGIANALNISTWTVHTHLKKIYEKLGAHSRTEALIKYLQK
jgi:DNA-binding NarL/FixJ family response regulator